MYATSIVQVRVCPPYFQLCILFWKHWSWSHINVQPLQARSLILSPSSHFNIHEDRVTSHMVFDNNKVPCSYWAVCIVICCGGVADDPSQTSAAFPVFTAAQFVWLGWAGWECSPQASQNWSAVHSCLSYSSAEHKWNHWKWSSFFAISSFLFIP